jgi:DNA modification methylase
MEIKAKEITLFPSVKLSEYPKNVNVHTEEQIDKIIQLIDFYGHRDPLIVDADLQPDGTHWVMAGNGRLSAAKKAGWDNLPIIFQKFNSEEEKYGFMVSHNAVSSSGWGGGLDLAKINTDIIDLGPDFDIEMLAIKDFVIEPIEKFEPQADEDEVPEVVHPITRKGDLWLLGNHRLMCGDSTMIDDVEKLMNGEKADMVFTDPPYNIASDSKNIASSVSKSMNDLKNSEWDKNFIIEDALNNIVPFIENGSIYVWTNHFLFQRIMDHLKSFTKFQGWCVWSKPNPMPSLMKRHWTWNMEICCYATIGKHVFNASEGKHDLALWSFNKKSDGSHPTQKPIELCEHPIIKSSNEKSLIMDLFLGSGSTLIACEKNNRKCFGMELDEKYCDVIINRWQNYTGKKAVLESTNQTYEELKLERGE